MNGDRDIGRSDLLPPVLVLVAVLAVCAWGCGSSDSGGPDITPRSDAGPEVEEIAADSASNRWETLPDLLREPDEQAVDVELEGLPDVQPAGPEPGSDFDRYCLLTSWNDEVVDTVEGKLSGEPVGAYNSLPPGALESMHFVPLHPFHLTHLRVQFAGGEGMARLRLMKDVGGSYPDVQAQDSDLMDPVELEVTEADANQWIEIDVAEQGVFLHPMQHYFLVYEHESAAPYLMIESIPEGEFFRAAIWLDNSWYAVGDDTGFSNYRMELAGTHFCIWTDEMRWFSETTPALVQEIPSERATVADVNGDGHDDLVVNHNGPRLLLNDTTGQFLLPEYQPWPDSSHISMLVFGDLDNDGDQDAVGLSWIGVDNDADGYLGGIGGEDCNDADAAVNPLAQEADNGYDDDCDGVADDGTDDNDDDQDGVSEADGDCDDTRADVYPGAPEIKDGRDNDCDLVTDEDFTNKVYLNDGSGQFATVDAPDLENTDPSLAGALGDYDSDGNLDLYYGNWLKHYPDPPAVLDHFYRGTGDGGFVEMTEAVGMGVEAQKGGLPCYGVGFVDYNDDGLQDVFVSNYGYGHNLMFENQGDGSFLEVGEAHGLSHDETYILIWNKSKGGNTYGADWADYDGDGDLDVYATNISHPRFQPWSDISQFLRSSGPPDYAFEDVREEAGVHYDEGDVNVNFFDYDNDGDVDLLISTLYTGHYASLYRNDGDGTFTDVSYEAGIRVHDAVSNVWSDFDHDGDLDVVVADREGQHRVHIFENNAVPEEIHWVEFSLEGVTANRSAIGARLTLEAGGKTQIREVKGGGGHGGNQSSLVAHFGLGTAEVIDKVTIRWPGGEAQTHDNLAVDKLYEIKQVEER